MELLANDISGDGGRIRDVAAGTGKRCDEAAELCEVGHQLGADPKAVVLGEAATETAIKAMSADGRLARARIVHFATHGLIVGELKGLAEPALVLTPPADDAQAGALEQDDGLLTASEVAALKLNADWVVLSACNTAAGDGNAQALSGLARAYFYARARLGADSDEAGQAFQYEAGHPFRDEAGHGSDLKPATWRSLRGSMG